MNLNLHLKIAGALMVMLALAHACFPVRFGWRHEMQKVSPFTRQVFYVHDFFIALVVFMFGLLSLVWTVTLLERNLLAKLVLAGLAIFWGARLFTQFFVYDARLWRGHAFNTVMHLLFSSMWVYYVTVYAVALWRQFSD